MCPACSRFLPDDWKGGFLLLVIVWILSSFLDNIAAALIGGAMAHQMFRGKVHIGYLAAIVAASNAGGSWSVIGDTTTTMMWIAGVAPPGFRSDYRGRVALCVFGIPAARQQQKYSPMVGRPEHAQVDWTRVGIVALILSFAIATNLIVNVHFPETRRTISRLSVWPCGWPFCVRVLLRRPDWEVLPEAFKGSHLPFVARFVCVHDAGGTAAPASWQTSFGLGFLSSVFDNIPLTALALKQGGYDWGFLAYAVGFGGSMIWFGSSAGVALSNIYPEAKSVGQWLRHGWYIAVAYVIGFFFMLALWTGTGHTASESRVAPALCSNRRTNVFCSGQTATLGRVNIPKVRLSSVKLSLSPPHGVPASCSFSLRHGLCRELETAATGVGRLPVPAAKPGTGSLPTPVAAVSNSRRRLCRREGAGRRTP